MEITIKDQQYRVGRGGNEFMCDDHELSFLGVIARRRDDGQDEMLSMSVCTECKEGVEEMGWREGYQCIES